MKSSIIFMPRRSGTRAHLAGIGRRVRELRGKVPQDEFAGVLGISQSQLSKIERGKLAPSIEVLTNLSERLGKSVDWIVKGKG